MLKPEHGYGIFLHRRLRRVVDHPKTRATGPYVLYHSIPLTLNCAFQAIDAAASSSTTSASHTPHRSSFDQQLRRGHHLHSRAANSRRRSELRRGRQRGEGTTSRRLAAVADRLATADVLAGDGDARQPCVMSWQKTVPI